jgi:xyloglucan-specific exo-beta-1,4-glucanase
MNLPVLLKMYEYPLDSSKRIKNIVMLFCALFPLLLQAQSYEWGTVKIGGGGFVSAIIPSQTEEGLIYARTDVGGAYRWDGANEQWIPLLDWVGEDQVGYLGVESLATDPRSPHKLYMLVGISYFNNGKTAILRSDDYGQTFSVTEVTSQFKANGNGMGRQNGEKLVVDANAPDILYTGTRWNGLFRSTDAGQSWSRLDALEVTTTPNENGISFVVLDSLSSPQGSPTKTMFVGVSRTGENLYRSDDAGETFTPVSGGPADLMPQRAVLDNSGNLYITYANGAGPHPHWAVPEPMNAGKVMKYHTETGVWTDVTPAGISSAFGGISVDPDDAGRIIVSTINMWWNQGSNNRHGDRFFLSEDGAASWTDVVERGYELDNDGFEWINNQSIHWAGSIEFDPFNTSKVWVTSGNGVYSTADVDATPSVWKFSVRNLEETVPLNLVSIPDGPLFSVIGDYDGFVHHDIQQPASIHRPGMGTTTGLDYAALNTDVLLRYGDKLYYSLDMGESWVETSRMGKKGQVALSADGEAFLHAPDGSRFTFRSTDRGETWTAAQGLSITSARPVADQFDPLKFYAYNPSNGTMYVSADHGESFAAAGSPGRSGSKIIRTVVGREGHLWVALYGGGLVRSTDAGENFSKIEGVSHAGAVGIGKAAPGSDYPTLFIWGTVDEVLGIHMSTDEGRSWIRINDDDHEYGGPGNGQFVLGDMNVYGRVYMSTAGRGIVSGQSSCDFSPVQAFMQVEGEEKQQINSLRLEEGKTVVLSPEPAESGTWHWTGPGDFTADSPEIRLTNIQKAQEGTYTANYTNPEGCVSPALQFTVEVETITAMEKNELLQKLDLYPNPSNGRMIIDLPHAGFSELNIMDMHGRPVLREKVETSASRVLLHATLRPGLYLIQLKNDKGILSSRFLIE